MTNSPPQPPHKLQEILRTRSLRFWVALGMLVALLPLALSAGAGYFLLDRGVIAPFHDVAKRQSEQVVPAQHLRLLIWDTLIPVDEYLQDGNPVHAEAYRNLRGQIEVEFSGLITALDGSPGAQSLVERARTNWTAADQLATALVSVVDPAANPQSAERQQRYHGEIVAASDRLTGAYSEISKAIMADHDMANLSYERSMWLAGIAAGISLLSIGLGVLLIGRVLSNSVDRLVDGANRFAEGNRSHRIDVSVPPELHRVAEEFNYMIGRIQESEEALAELAMKDSLTGLGNRRAFEGAMADTWARHQRHREPGVLLAIDLDHFKQINDTYGHAAGDDVLRSVARLMVRSLRPFDKVFRTGGEEFSVLLPCTGLSDARDAAERLRRSVASNPVPSKGTVIKVTVSIGMAVLSSELDQAALVERADKALYTAKSAGRNRLVIDGEESVARAV